MQHDVRPLIEQLDDLLGQLDRVNAEAADMLADVHPEHRAGAENLLHYAHLRTIDIRELQNGLHDLGVTSLTTAESGVYGRLAIARAVLRALVGDEVDTDVDEYIRQDDAADVALDANSDRLFGEEREGVPARIMVTLRPRPPTTPSWCWASPRPGWTSPASIAPTTARSRGGR
nr:hypothetical protein [Corynebacterium xerosis]